MNNNKYFIGWSMNGNHNEVSQVTPQSFLCNSLLEIKDTNGKLATSRS